MNIFKKSNQTTDKSSEAEIRQSVHKLIETYPVAVLATVSFDNTPHATPVYVVADKQLNIMFISKRDTLKSRNILKNKNVMLVVFETKTQANLQVIGKAIEITDSSSADEVFKKVIKISSKVSKTVVPPVSKLFAGHYVAYSVKPSEITLSTYNPGSGEKAQFEKIKF